MKFPFSTERLEFSRIIESDLPWLYNLMKDPDVMRYSLKGPLTNEEAREAIDRDAFNAYKTYGFGHWACRLKETGEPIGYCGLTMKTVDEVSIPELGYRLFSIHWGNGYATEAVKAVKEYAFSTLHLPKIISIIDPLNSASVRVAQKNGILYEYSTFYKGFNMGIYSSINHF